MARDIDSRFRLSGTLVTSSPLHVGGHSDDVDTDLPLARDGAGQLYVPGTSLAGAFREWTEWLFGEDVSNGLWGFQQEDRGHASFFVIDDAAIENTKTVVVEVRDHVGIDRQWGAAAEPIKYDRAILPRGTRIKLQLMVEVPEPAKRGETLSMLAVLKQALERGDVRLGAAKTRGLGHVRLEEGELTEQVIGTRNGILGLLRQANGNPVSQNEIVQACRAHRPRSWPRLRLTVRWHPIGPLMVKAGFDGIAADMLPLTSGNAGQVSLVLPGSSIKGALRSQAERIVRTVLNDAQPNWLAESNPRKRFLKAVELELIDELFGKRGEKVAKDDPRSWLPGLGALAIIDCFTEQRLGVEQWQSLQSATDDRQLLQALDQAGLQSWSQAYHVAIDRWLGSAAESMLYTLLEPHCTAWEPLTLDVDLRRLPDNLHLPGLTLLLLLIRDLAQQRLPLGFATHRGMGTVCIEAVQLSGVELPQPLDELNQVDLPGGCLRGLPPSVREAMNNAWQRWIEQNGQEVTP